MKVFDACPAPGAAAELLYHFPPTSENRHVFRHIGAIYFDIVDIFQYSGTMCLIAYESGVGMIESTGHGGFRPTYATGVVHMGEHPVGDLVITDATGKLLLKERLSAGKNQIATSPGFAGGVRQAILSNPSGRWVHRFVAID